MHRRRKADWLSHVLCDANDGGECGLPYWKRAVFDKALHSIWSVCHVNFCQSLLGPISETIKQLLSLIFSHLPHVLVIPSCASLCVYDERNGEERERCVLYIERYVAQRFLLTSVLLDTGDDSLLTIPTLMESEPVEELDASSTPSFHDIDERALMRRVDKRLIPILFLVYVAAFLDRYDFVESCRTGLTCVV